MLLRVMQIHTSQIHLPEVCFAEPRPNLRIRFTPLVPGFDPFLFKEFDFEHGRPQHHPLTLSIGARLQERTGVQLY